MDIFQNKFMLQCDTFLLAKGFEYRDGKYYLNDVAITVGGSRIDIKTNAGSRALYGNVSEQVLLEFIERHWEG